MPKSKKAPPGKTKPGQRKVSVEQRRALFIEAFLSNGENATQAALAAGFSASSAASQGSRLLKNDKVSQEIARRRSEVLESAELTTEGVLRSLRQALFFDPRKLYREDGSLKPITELDDDTAQALSGFEVLEEYAGRGEDRALAGFTKKVKWLDKNAAREQAAKVLGLYARDNHQKTDPLAALIQQLGRTSPPIVARDPDHK